MALILSKARAGIAALTFAAAMVGLPASSATINLGPGNFGDLSQRDPALTDVCGGAPNVACGPVAATNSFIFLQNEYPAIYGNSLTGGSTNNDLVATATALSGPNFMNCMACQGGTFADDFYTGKMNWINQKAPGSTIFSRDRMPSIAALALDLANAQDTELLVGFYTANGARMGGHYVTLFALDTFPDGSDIGFIDPDTGPPAEDLDFPYTVTSSFCPVSPPCIQIDGYARGFTTIVEQAFGEAAVPGPVVGAGVPGLIAACALLLGWARRRRTV